MQDVTHFGKRKRFFHSCFHSNEPLVYTIIPQACAKRCRFAGCSFAIARKKNNRKNEIERGESKCCTVNDFHNQSSFRFVLRRLRETIREVAARQKAPGSFASFTRDERVSDCRERNDIRNKSVGFRLEARHISTASHGVVKLATYFSNVSSARLCFTNSQRLRPLFRFELFATRNLSV